MSGRIRSIKPELLEDAVTAGLSETAFRLFVGAILLADDWGGFRAEPGFLSGQVFWKTPPSKPVEEALAELGSKLVLLYQVNGQTYGFIRSWEKHQKVSRRGKRRMPSPPEDLQPLHATVRTSAGQSHADRTTPSVHPPDSLNADLRSQIIDHRSSTTDQGASRDDGGGLGQSDPEPERAESPPSPPRPPGLFGEELSIFHSAVAAGINRQVSKPKPFALTDIRRGIDAHAPGPLSSDGLVAWLRESVTRWARLHAAPHHARYTGGYSPDAWVKWLDAGATDPNAAAPPRAPAIVSAPARSRRIFDHRSVDRPEPATSPESGSALRDAS